MQRRLPFGLILHFQDKGGWDKKYDDKVKK